MEIKEKIQELMANEEFVKRIFAMEPDDVQKAFAEEGIDITIDEIVDVGQRINTILQDGGELNEEALEAVAGGGKVGKAIGSFILGCVIGAGIAGGAALAGAMLAW